VHPKRIDAHNFYKNRLLRYNEQCQPLELGFHSKYHSLQEIISQTVVGGDNDEEIPAENLGEV
jgi:hypothetical protein